MFTASLYIIIFTNIHILAYIKSNNIVFVYVYMTSNDVNYHIKSKTELNYYKIL